MRRRDPVSLPPTESVPWPKLKTAQKERERLLAEQAKTTAELEQLAAERETAVRADRQRLASAIRAGKPDTGDDAVRKLDEQIAATTRRAEALEDGLDQVETELDALVDEHRSAWAKDSDKRIEKARRTLGEAVEHYVDARRELDGELALAGWLATFPGAKAYRPWTRPLRGLIGPNGDDAEFDAVTAALRADVQPPPVPKPPAEPKPLRSRETVGVYIPPSHD